MRRLSPAELALFLVPVALVPLAIYGQRWKIAVTPTPTPVPTPTPTPAPNLYTNYRGNINIESVLPSRDGKWIYMGVHEKTTFSKWNAKTGALVLRFGVFRFGNGQAVLSPDGRLLGFGYGGWKGDRVVLFDTNTGREHRQFVSSRSIEGGYAYFALNDEVVAMPTYDDVRLVRIKDRRLVGKLCRRNFDYYPKRPIFSPDGSQLAWIGFSNRDFPSYANGNSNDEVVWFDWKSRKRLGAYEFPHCDLFNVRFSGDGRVLLVWGFRRYWIKSRTGNNSVGAQEKMWAIDARTSKKIWEWNMSGWGNDLGVSPDGKLFSTSQDYKDPNFTSYTVIREVKTNREVATVPLSSSYISAWSPDSRTLYIPANGLRRITRQPNGSWNSNKRAK